MDADEDKNHSWKKWNSYPERLPQSDISETLGAEDRSSSEGSDLSLPTSQEFSLSAKLLSAFLPPATTAQQEVHRTTVTAREKATKYNNEQKHQQRRGK